MNRLLARGKFRHIQVLLALVEFGSVQRAADAIGLTQPSVTQTLAALEELLELPLFERHARGVRPTPACHDLLPTARQLMHGLAGGAEAVTARQHQGKGLVRLLASAAAIGAVLVEALPTFAERHPGLTVTVSEREGPDQLQSLARGEADLAVCRRRATLPKPWGFEALCTDHMVVVCRHDHPLAGQAELSLAALQRHEWLAMPAGTAARAHFETLAAGLACAPSLSPIVTRSWTLAAWLLRRHALLALLPQAVVRPQLDAGELVALPLGLDMPLEPIGLLLPGHGLAPAAQALARHLAERACAGSSLPA